MKVTFGQYGCLRLFTFMLEAVAQGLRALMPCASNDGSSVSENGRSAKEMDVYLVPLTIVLAVYFEEGDPLSVDQGAQNARILVAGANGLQGSISCNLNGDSHQL